MKRFTATRGRKVATAVTSTLLICAVVAVAFYLVLATGSGSGKQKLGKGSAAQIGLTLIWSEGLIPGSGDAITIKGVNSTTSVTDVKKMTITPSIEGVPGCLPAWFTVTDPSGLLTTGLTTPVTIPTGGVPTTISTTAEVLFKEESGTNQSACENQTLTLTATSTP
jgi:hypothetical protein